METQSQKNVYQKDTIFYNNNFTRRTGNGRLLVDNSFFNSNNEFHKILRSPYNENILDKNFIRFAISLKEQHHRKKEFFEGIEYSLIDNLMKRSLVEILSFNPDRLTLELSTEKILFYTLFKDKFTCFISHFIITNPNDPDDHEVIISLFKNKIKQPSFSGLLNEGISFLNTNFRSNEVMSLEWNA